MDELPTTATWAAVALAALAIAWAILRRKWASKDAATKAKRLHYNEYIATLHEWQDAIESGDKEVAVEAARRLAWMKEQKWNVAPLVFAALLLLSGCRTPPPEPVVLNDHVRIVHPGDTVPPLPSGETGWWLATPTGMGMLLPVEDRVLLNSHNQAVD